MGNDAFEPGHIYTPVTAPDGEIAYLDSVPLQGNVTQTALQRNVENDFSNDDTGPTASCPILLPEIPKLDLSKPPRPPKKPLVGGVSINAPAPQIQLQAETPMYDYSLTGKPGTPGNPLIGSASQTKLVTGITENVPRPTKPTVKKKTIKKKPRPGPTGGKPRPPLKTGIKVNERTPEPEDDNFKWKYPQTKWGTEIPMGGKKGDAEKSRTTRLIGFEYSARKVGNDNLNVSAGATAGDISIVNTKENQSLEANISAAGSRFRARSGTSADMLRPSSRSASWKPAPNLP